MWGGGLERWVWRRWVWVREGMGRWVREVSLGKVGVSQRRKVMGGR